MATKPTKITIDAKEAVNRLAHPTFFDHDQRLAAYEIVMRDGNDKQKETASQALRLWPINGIKATA
jgi:hypothetical protein